MRFDFINYLKLFIGSRYQWTGEGPYSMGFDCSGLVLEGLRSIGFWGREDATAQTIYNKLSKASLTKLTPKPDTGDLLFFGKSLFEVTHIGVAINNYQYIEAGGGDSKSTDKGMVRIRRIDYRKDFLTHLSIFN